MQIFLVSYAVVCIAEIFSVGGFLTDRHVLVVRGFLLGRSVVPLT